MAYDNESNHINENENNGIDENMDDDEIDIDEKYADIIEMFKAYYKYETEREKTRILNLKKMPVVNKMERFLKDCDAEYDIRFIKCEITSGVLMIITTNILAINDKEKLKLFTDMLGQFQTLAISPCAGKHIAIKISVDDFYLELTEKSDLDGIPTDDGLPEDDE